MQPQIHVNMIAVLVAVLVSFVFGFLWYGPLFGKKWAKLMKMSMDKKPDTKVMMRSMGLTLLGTFLTVYVLYHDIVVWHPSLWKAGADGPAYSYGFYAGFFIWIGYYIPMLLGTVSWEGRSWSLFGLNAAYNFLNLQIIGIILAYMS